MNCLGKGNYIYFLGLLASLGVLLSYGSYLTYVLLTETLQADMSPESNIAHPKIRWSAGKTWSEIFHSWGWAFAHDVGIGSTGMLAVMTAPLAWGLFLYHIYLVWAGMTTNESSKWADLRDDIADGFVFRTERKLNSTQINMEIEPLINWPISSTQKLVCTQDGHPPACRNAIATHMDTVSRNIVPDSPQWRRLESLQEVQNLYDLGFRDNLFDTLPV